MSMQEDSGSSARGDRTAPIAPDIVFFGSGEFGRPTLERLALDGRVALVVSQPPRRAGRGRTRQATPIAAAAQQIGIPLLESADIGIGTDLERIRGIAADTFVVIAFGQKLSPTLLADRFAINLHGSILPKWRGAAPIQRAVMEGDRRLGVSVIALAERMDAGEVYAVADLERGESETAGELHDRLALLGPDLIMRVLESRRLGSLRGELQDESRATRARKLSRDDAWVSFDLPATSVAARINGLSPWPGCEAQIGGESVRLLRARAIVEDRRSEAGGGVVRGIAASESGPGSGPIRSGTLDASGRVRCGAGAVELLEVQSPGGRVMPFESWRRGHPRIGTGAMVSSEARRDSPPPSSH